MSDTIGSLVDKLATVNNKMFFNQEFLYEIRRMDWHEFINEYGHDGTKLRLLHESLCKIADLNLQRQALILEHDKMLVKLVLDLIDDRNLASKYIINQHKTLSEPE
jgi:hypothetical protein